jgi:uncharacterized membrane protein
MIEPTRRSEERMKYERAFDIAADADRVGATGIDVETWPDWTESVDSAQRLDDGAFAVGSRARLKQPKMRVAEWEVTELETGRFFVWRTRTGGLGMVATHAMQPAADGVRVTLSFELTGTLSGLIGRLVGGRIRRYLEMEADGLKAHCEA